ncbi:MAG TPA: ATPase domain-containing protein [Bryobacteraceae bacterium]|nr:ATPase domain-containing protein [Bryobacteraceae bacterium]
MVNTSLSSRLLTGVSGLDEILYGGLQKNNVFLVEGDPGTGKTTLALQFLLSGAAQGERGLLLTLSESRRELNSIARSHGWSLDSIDIVELIPAEANLNPDESYTFFHPEEIELADTVQALNNEIEKARPARVVVDSLAELRLLAQDARHYRRQILALKKHLTGRDITVLLLDDRTSANRERQLHSVVHGVISMERLAREYGKIRRRLEISKMRGAAFMEGFHDYTIDTGGLRIFPRLIAAQHHAAFDRQSILSGVEELDNLLGGGLDRGSSTLITGPAGCGKSTLALKYAIGAARRGEHIGIYTFEESKTSLLARTEALGIPLRSGIENGSILVEQIDPAELSPGEFAARVRHSVEHQGARMIVIDSLNGYLAAMPQEEFLTLQMHELLSYLNEQGVVTILVLAQHGVFELENSVDLSYMADAIILLRFFEARGEVRKAVSVVKKRSSGHERTIRELEIVPDAGIRVGRPLTAFQGVLSGIPEYTGDVGSLGHAEPNEHQ